MRECKCAASSHDFNIAKVEDSALRRRALVLSCGWISRWSQIYMQQFGQLGLFCGQLLVSLAAGVLYSAAKLISADIQLLDANLGISGWL